MHVFASWGKLTQIGVQMQLQVKLAKLVPTCILGRAGPYVSGGYGGKWGRQVEQYLTS